VKRLIDEVVEGLVKEEVELFITDTLQGHLNESRATLLIDRLLVDTVDEEYLTALVTIPCVVLCTVRWCTCYSLQHQYNTKIIILLDSAYGNKVTNVLCTINNAIEVIHVYQHIYTYHTLPTLL